MLAVLTEEQYVMEIPLARETQSTPTRRAEMPKC